VFGKGTIAKLAELVPADQKVLITYGGGSIMENGVYDQVKAALARHQVLEFGGIEPNPRYETLMKAVEIVKRENVGFLLSVGGGSVLDGTKFIAVAARFSGEPWDIPEKGAAATDAVPLGDVLTLPATGSEMNCFAVISRKETAQKLAFACPHVFPKFSILDPEVTFSLPERQIANGIVDAFVHVCEQYMTFPVNAPLQDRQSEAIYLTLIDEGPKTLADPTDYDSRANLVWAATHALNGWINCGVPQDWTTHMIGHELTAIRGIDHARTLALVLPALWQHQRKEKGDKLVQYAARVWGITGNDNNPENNDRDTVIDQAIAKTKEFFASVGIRPSKQEYGITDDDCRKVAKILGDRGLLGERGNIGEKQILEILQLCD